MSENQLLQQVLEMLRRVEHEQKEQREVLIALSTKFDSHQGDFESSKAKIELLETKVNKAEGVLSFLKILAGFMLGGVLSFGVWVNKEVHRIDNEIIKIEHNKDN